MRLVNFSNRETRKALAIGAAACLAACVLLPPETNPAIIVGSWWAKFRAPKVKI